MTKGIPWNVEEEIQLKKLIEANTPIDVIASTLKRTPTAILLKCQHHRFSAIRASTLQGKDQAS